MDSISLEGVRQNNLKNFSIRIPVGKLVVVSGVSGSGKSSFAVETLCAEGQRRYIETFSPYARQFMERIGRPAVERVRDIPPAVSIYQGNPVKTSRSTVATMSELADFLKALFAKRSSVFCTSCGREVRREHPQDVLESVMTSMGGKQVLVTFPVRLAGGFRPEEIAHLLKSQGLGRLLRGDEIVPVAPEAISSSGKEIEVLMDIVRAEERNRGRMADSISGAMRFGQGRVNVLPLEEAAGRAMHEGRLAFSDSLHCPYCDVHYPDPNPNFFSYNSPVGACTRCRGFGNLIRIDPRKVIPDERKSLREGAVRPWVSGYSAECQKDLMRFLGREGIPADVPYRDLQEEQKRLIWDGKGSWYGISGYFAYLEKKSYKMHMRVLLSRYRSYLVCPDCGGSRFRPDRLAYRVGGMTIADAYRMSVHEAISYVRGIEKVMSGDAAALMIVREMKKRLEYMERVGIGYLTLDRESRTLSGGELGRLRLASALGANLTNTLYVLDEPTVGLHPRDVENLLGVLDDLKKRGNTVVVVEHDLRVMRAADLLVDLGPGPGTAGGEVVYCGPPCLPAGQAGSLTTRYLAGLESIARPAERRRRKRTDSLRIAGANHRNLHDIDVEIPLGLFVCITGVSGSGKSTLVRDVLYANMKSFLDSGGPPPSGCRRIEGWTRISEVVFIDSTPAASTPRANPATYTGLVKVIRELIASTPLARKRDYAPSMFSFNSGEGRCPACGGAGYEKIEMQFLSDLYVRCRECDGRRFRKEVLEVRYEGRNIDDMLSMTIQEAHDFLAAHSPGKAGAVEMLIKVGLGYLRIGQPLSTLSGGEIQRLKIASVLAERKKRKGRRLVLMDEPTTGMHPADVRGFLDLVGEIVEDGDGVVVIEHNMDVVKCCDWVIDLGPEGGDGGGRVVVAGTPEEAAACPWSRTAPYLDEALSGAAPAAARSVSEAVERQYEKSGGGERSIEIFGARHNNLRGVDVKIPLGRITLVTGLSGSGKSSLAFDVLFAEGQRRYLDSVSPYVRQYLTQVPHPDVDYISGLPPTVAIEQRSSRGGARSSVGTLTEVQPFLRLLFARIGTRRCPECGVEVVQRSVESITDEIIREQGKRRVILLAPVVRGRKGFHGRVFASAARRGYGKVRVDGRLLSIKSIPALSRYREHFIDIVVGEIVPRRAGRKETRALLKKAAEIGKGVLVMLAASDSGGGKEEKVFSLLNQCPLCATGFDELDPRNFSFNSSIGACQRCRGLGIVGVEEEMDHDGGSICPACKGKRLKKEFLHVFVKGWSIADLCSLSIEKALKTFGKMKFDGHEEKIAAPIVGEIIARLRFLKKVGVGYLSLDRRADTLSTGEGQRVKLAASLGSEMMGVCYVLDEPTIGLHPRDTAMMRGVMRDLVDAGSSVVVVEHDEEMVRSADWCIELGPGGGREGGLVVATGRPEELAAGESCPTGKVLAHPILHPARGNYRPPGEKFLEIYGARAHNLKSVDVRIPLERFVCITGVSGSGKSSLLEDVILDGWRRHAGRMDAGMPAYERINGFDKILNVKYVDQTPIGRTPRSTVSTYVGFMTEIRRLFGEVPESRMRGYGPSQFSFNTRGGRCEGCKGQGIKKERMTFLPLVHVLCEKCGGRRYGEELLKVKYRGRSIADVLDMTVSEARDFFAVHRRIAAALGILKETGLGYVLLGQSSPTLSGGEAQRIKLAAEMSSTSQVKGVMYLLEEPTTGLHALDVEKIVAAFHRLVDLGATVVVIEHNLDVVAEADWIVDLGPGGGENGGSVTAIGSAYDLVRRPGSSLTARFLEAKIGAG